MEKTAFSVHDDLLSLISEVKKSKEIQEIRLRESFEDLAQSLSPVEVVKSSIHELVTDKGMQFDLIKGGMNLGVNYLIEKVFNKNGSVKGFLSSVLLEKVSASFIQTNAASIIVGVEKLFSAKTETSE